MTSIGDTFDFPSEWEPAIVEYVLSKTRSTDRDSVLEAGHMAKYEAMRQSAFLINKNMMYGDALA